MQIHNATIDDHSTVLSMVWTYACNSPYKDKVNALAVDLLVKEFLTEKDKVVFYVTEDNLPIGFIAGAALPFILGLDTLATEFALWVHPEFRLNGVGSLLIETFEQWGRDSGCSAVVLSSMDDKVGKSYFKLGYVLKEYSFMKVLS